MGALADLIATAFAEQLDRTGRQMVGGMRLLSRLGWLGWLLGRWLLPPAANPVGFVWEQDGRIVGNASLMPVRNYGQRWVMANVAVHPEYRRRGIANQLVHASIDAVRERGARELILQVDRGNEVARAMYQHFGFRLLSDRTTWYRQRGLQAVPAPSSVHVGPREPGEWHAQYALARRVYPEGLIWPFPTVPSLFRPAGASWFNGRSRSHWLWRANGRVEGSLSLRPGVEPGLQRILLIVDSEVSELAEPALLDCACSRPMSRYSAFVLDYKTGAAEDALRIRGFEPRRQLLWMGLDLHTNPTRREDQA
jgi:ribosomal protein S18 acetylase RimI-like enzyme